MKAPADHVAMMQIDCEVMNTRLIHIREDAIPANLNHHRSSAANSSRNGSFNQQQPTSDNSSLQRNESSQHRGHHQHHHHDGAGVGDLEASSSYDRFVAAEDQIYNGKAPSAYNQERRQQQRQRRVPRNAGGKRPARNNAGTKKRL